MAAKNCPHCNQFKPLSEFYKNKSRPSGVASWCKECVKKDASKWAKNNRSKINKRRRKYAKENPNYNRQNNLKRNYNISLTEYEQIEHQQNGVCAICNKRETYKNQYSLARLSVDHDHITGEIRGLLCKNCNLGLGYFKDNIASLSSAINYLLKSKGE